MFGCCLDFGTIVGVSQMIVKSLQLSEAGLKALGQCSMLELVNADQTQGVTDVVSALCEGTCH